MPILPQAIPIPPEAAIASYSYTDIAEGTGIVNFYGMSTQDSTAEEYVLNTAVYYSDDIETEIAGTSDSSFVKLLDLDFDLSAFNLPKVVKGTATFSIPWGFVNTGYFYEAYIIVRVKKNDVEAASVQSATFDGTGPGKIGELSLLNVVIPQTNYKKGDVLRVTIELWAKQTSGSGALGTFDIYHDPKSRTIASATTLGLPTTTLQMGIPFKIDL